MGENIVYLVDTNIIIYHFNNKIPENSKSKIRDIFLKNFNTSIISKIEFLGFRKHTDESFQKSKIFLNNANIIDINENIVDTAIDLRRSSKIKLADSIIAASAMNHDLTIVTRNVDDFKNIDLKIYNPFSN